MSPMSFRCPNQVSTEDVMSTLEWLLNKKQVQSVSIHINKNKLSVVLLSLQLTSD